ncbi:Ubiquitin-associated/translation elongation factor EF1B [Lasiodiplodia theobromae]|uniref:UV excision repair protein RAD23 n=1 Tax=Lasiodiplodia hormozganensis TaxID=869390 RepID=A0AA40CGW2_9PEZI|nr:UV excision repair protein [Lasiodiplodia theobromae]KAF4544469.1 UV excision repair protein [Lasiodiplodia theobromae]KAF9634170.1 Ubiquitin-associated/translation elongation factor EF1B [Lasiodiplodia theobromae]KAK0637835.1 UV excision repair protein rhp23 [Lasiodiplodia hormozganensis]
MKLTFKDLKQQKFVIEAEPSETIADVKAKISAEKGWEADKQKLIYSGKILQDDKTVESYNIEEKGFIVCMIQKPKPQPAASASKAAPSTPAREPAQASTPSAPAQSSSTTPNVPATPSPAPAAPQAQAQGGQFNNPSSLTMGPEREAAIANMESMGFPRADIDRAMRAAYFNPDRAVEYLLTGIPESALRDAPAQQGGAPAPAAGAGAQTAAPQAASGGDEPVNLFEAAAGQGGRGGAGARGAAAAGAGAGAGAGAAAAAAAGAGAGDLDFLRNNPQFQQLRQLVQQQPHMLEPILQQVGQGNPGLAQLIADHPEQFLSLLSEDHDDDTPLPPGAQVVSITEEESEAIDRLCRLGFERDLVVQAYFACDKNEELAANFLFDQPEDDDQQ